MNDFETLPKSSIIAVTFEVALPCDATKEEIMEWISHNLNEGGIRTDNPLLKFGMEAINVPVLAETETYLHTNVEKNDSGWLVKKWREQNRYTGKDPLDIIMNDHK